ncbi:ferritin-like domain-containing protein [Calothrix sp. NIES-2098]|uniref:ferritin-like domain-containing protein n=1 Tax=Calothrix sp. NIES-2098 TaxID=1954171 RepID=UPI000B617EF4|nr:hypothetical protein NIES2098_38400 [Calothrix sp. NIES-2098]
MKIGSEFHKELFCRSFIDSHIKYQPEQLPWPELDAVSLDRLRKIPFWEEALNTELAAGAKINAYLPMISDPFLYEAVALQGEEEARHGRLFQFLIQHYGIETSGQPPAQLSGNPEQAFIDFGYGECLDSFLGFGLFKIARQSGFLPEPMFKIFDLLLQEEARHIVFFVNWIAYIQVSRGRGAKVLRGLSSVWNYGKAAQRMMGVVDRSSQSNSQDFAATEASVFLDNFSVELLISECLAENARRMSEFDSRLLQPQLLPTLAKGALRVVRAFSQRSSPANEKIAS